MQPIGIRSDYLGYYVPIVLRVDNYYASVCILIKISINLFVIDSTCTNNIIWSSHIINIEIFSIGYNIDCFVIIILLYNITYYRWRPAESALTGAAIYKKVYISMVGMVWHAMIRIGYSWLSPVCSLTERSCRGRTRYTHTYFMYKEKRRVKK